MCIHLKLFVLLPVYVAIVERSFSGLRILKTYLKNKTSETRLYGRALLFGNRDIRVSDVGEKCD